MKILVIAGILLLGPVAGAEAATIFSEDFSGATEGGYGGAIPGTQLTVTQGNVDVIGPATYSCVANAAIKCLDLVGSSTTGTVQSTVGFNLVAGTSYTIAYTDVLQGFAFGSSPELDYKVSLGSYEFDVTSIPTVTAISLMFTAAANEANALLTFKTITSVDCCHGPVISGLSIDASVATTPLPAALPLFASALAGMGFLSWRRKRSAA
jgi:hypothetical protein